MKELFFITVKVIFLSGSPFVLSAQTSVNIEQVNRKASPASKLKFIDHIQITPGNSSIKEEVIVQNEYAGANSEKKFTISTTNSIEKFTGLQFKYAMLMDIDVEAITNTTLFTAIETWWATPYQYGGDDKKGIDCSAFCGKIFNTVFNQTLPRTAKEQYAICNKIDRADLQEGDLVFFNTRGGVSHVGIYLTNNNFAHSSIRSGVTISSLNEDYYNKKFIGAGRIGK
jgi:lipoprotein Spr